MQEGGPKENRTALFFVHFFVHLYMLNVLFLLFFSSNFAINI